VRPLLVVEGIPARARAAAQTRGIVAGSELVCNAVRAIAPALPCVVICAADAGTTLPAGTSLRDYCGVIIGGSNLHVYEPIPEVRRQLALVRAVGEAGLPIFGSCWGLQVAAVVAGGRVSRNERGREVGVARKIVPTAAGMQHPLLARKGACYDALCIHYDDIDLPPAGCTVLARNAHSAVQAAVIPLGRSEVWGVQYHPEFDLRQVALLMELYADDMIAQRLYADRADLEAGIGKWRMLAADPANVGLAWQLGLDDDTINDDFRRLELANWLRQLG